MTNSLEQAIAAVNQSKTAFCKFISANDAGATGAHQEGFYMPKSTISLMFDSPGIKGSNKERFVRIKWHNDFTTESRFIYYGTGTRNEYRLTRFGKGFPFFEENNVGDLLVLCHMDEDQYEGYVLSSDEDIDDFFAAFNITSESTNKLIDKDIKYKPEDKLKALLDSVVNGASDFLSTSEMAMNARDCFLEAYKIKNETIIEYPDSQLLKWLDAEYELFKAFEIKLYSERIKSPFTSVEELIVYSNSILNRRKSRAGKSLEHHLEKIFRVAELRFETQVVTEENKKPDFIFPDGTSYHNFEFPADKLICLGAKTTCKDRWRQVINEADRIPVKHLFTLQQGISKNQLTEMYSNNIKLVVPKSYINSFDTSFRERIMSLETFNAFVCEKQR